ncbi:Prefoldin beta-like protein [Rhodotorula sp. JG-1b]|nr:Prefoldin beta-like protein [Rhodotorula sp. JG-1b]
MSSGSGGKALTEQEIGVQVRQRQSELQALVQKLTDLERDAEEHALVLETLQEACKTEPDRKCFRLVGGVLVERTVKDVSPQLESQYEQIKALLETLASQYKTKEAAFAEWQRDNNVVIRQR